MISTNVVGAREARRGVAQTRTLLPTRHCMNVIDCVRCSSGPQLSLGTCARFESLRLCREFTDEWSGEISSNGRKCLRSGA